MVNYWVERGYVMEILCTVEYQKEGKWCLHGTFLLREALNQGTDLLNSGNFSKVRVRRYGGVILWEETYNPPLPSPAEYSAQYQAYQEAWEQGQDTARD